MLFQINEIARIFRVPPHMVGDLEAYNEIADEIFRLRELKQQTAVDTASRDAQIGRITDLQDFIRCQPVELTEFDEVLVKRWVQKTTVWPDRFTVELKSGLSVDIEG